MALTTEPAPADPAAEAAKLLREDSGALYQFFEHWWLVATIAVLLGLAAYLLVRWLRNRPPPLPPTARAIALRELAELRNKVTTMEPHAFSIAVSDILRAYIGGHYGLAVRQQTSPEFLAGISASPKFSDRERTLLERFLERADLIKFARIEATGEDNDELLGSALGFVQGERS